jgi:cytochrome oxidase Cu insertion factor (SCO1/SenC/PrrC family)
VAATEQRAPAADASLKRLRLALAVAVALLIVGVVALILMRPKSEPSGAAATATPAATWAAGAKKAPDFTLTDERGKPVSLAALRGRPVVITFIDPLCRDYCPTEAQRLNDVADAFPAGSKPAIVAVSVNVDGNARSNLLQDVRKWKLVPEWRWAVGSGAQLARVWDRYHIEVLVSSKTIAGVKVRQIAHTEAAYVIDANGDQRALFLWPYRADGVVRTLRALGPSAS